MKKKIFLTIVITTFFLLLGCGSTNSANNDKAPPNLANGSVDNNQQISVEQNGNKSNTSNQQNSTQQNGNESLPEYTPTEEESQIVGTLTVNLNGKDLTYTTTLPIDNKTGSDGSWSVIFSDQDSIYIQLPPRVKAGDEFTAEDGQMSANSWGPPAFSFVYTDKSGNNAAIYDNNVYDAFGLIIDKWEGRGGYVEGRFAAEIRPLVGDSIIMKNGRFKVQIRN